MVYFIFLVILALSTVEYIVSIVQTIKTGYKLKSEGKEPYVGHTVIATTLAHVISLAVMLLAAAIVNYLWDVNYGFEILIVSALLYLVKNVESNFIGAIYMHILMKSMTKKAKKEVEETGTTEGVFPFK